MNGRTFVLVAEDHAHLLLASHLGDRVAEQVHPWLVGLLDDGTYREWRGFTEEQEWLKWTSLTELCRQHHVPRVHGLNHGLQRANAVRALRLLRTRSQMPQAVVFLTDADKNDAEKVRLSLERARDSNPWPFAVVIGVCAPEAEAWCLNLFWPVDAEERRRIELLRQELGFHPCEGAERLSSGRDEHKRSAKRVLGLLVNEAPARAATSERVSQCLSGGDLASIEERGRKTGLSAFLSELRAHLAPCYAR